MNHNEIEEAANSIREATALIKELSTKLEVAAGALNRIGMLQMGALDYTEDFFEQTKVIVRETLLVINGVNQ